MKERATRTAIVTGGGSGIGLAISERLASRGQPVAIFDLNADGAKAAATTIEAEGGRAIGLQVDVTNRSGVEEAVEEVRRDLGPPTVLVNNAGVAAFEDFLQIDINEWRRMIEVNLTGTFQCCQVVIPDMLAEGWGRIVNISSSSVHSGTRRQAHYVAAKSGVVGLTKCLAVGIRALRNHRQHDSSRVYRHPASATSRSGGSARHREGNGRHAGWPARKTRGHRRGMRVSRQRGRRLRHRTDHRGQRRAQYLAEQRVNGRSWWISE